MSVPQDITHLLIRLRSGDEDAEEDLVRIIYPDLHNLAARCLNGERPGHDLQPTMLVNEIYLRLIGKRKVEFQSRTHFFAVAGNVMRRILVDYARTQNAAKRGGGVTDAPIEQLQLLTAEQSGLVLSLNDCLNRLGQLDKRQAQVVEMRFFGGLSEEEIAEILGVSARTVKREWASARAWLHAELRP